eukprot:TRINITY_DN2290_c0_g2_i1.p1 TRINITY_DN2290_c0_g2~~TRINITY_DN2290_c0_g2_i1.p1  ORF type:complete len:345 (+),score=106.17 TRINITY_DN2290_c0_g2_i1:40-1074(+)
MGCVKCLGILVLIFALLIGVFIFLVNHRVTPIDESPYDTTPLPKKYVTVLGKKMAYYEEGEGDPIVFLHGNPTSSYLWRNIIPFVQGKGRIIAPDLIGMGDSEKLEIQSENEDPDFRYSFFEHSKYLDALLEELLGELSKEGNKVTIVIHDWGSALGFHWAHRHQNAIKGICFGEAIVGPFDHGSDTVFGYIAFQVFHMMRTIGLGEWMVLDHDFFVEYILPLSIQRKLSKVELDQYIKPYRNKGEDRRPTLTWPRMVPIHGMPKDVHTVVSEYHEWLKTTTFPKLWINANPGAILRHPAAREFCRNLINVTHTTVNGIHFFQEDSPNEIGFALSEWYDNINEK